MWSRLFGMSILMLNGTWCATLVENLISSAEPEAEISPLMTDCVATASVANVGTTAVGDLDPNIRSFPGMDICVTISGDVDTCGSQSSASLFTDVNIYRSDDTLVGHFAYEFTLERATLVGVQCAYFPTCDMNTFLTQVELPDVYKVRVNSTLIGVGSNDSNALGSFSASLRSNTLSLSEQMTVSPLTHSIPFLGNVTVIAPHNFCGTKDECTFAITSDAYLPAEPYIGTADTEAFKVDCSYSDGAFYNNMATFYPVPEKLAECQADPSSATCGATITVSYGGNLPPPEGGEGGDGGDGGNEPPPEGGDGGNEPPPEGGDGGNEPPPEGGDGGVGEQPCDPADPSASPTGYTAMVLFLASIYALM